VLLDIHLGERVLLVLGVDVVLVGVYAFDTDFDADR
jgi:hypothetical protein